MSLAAMTAAAVAAASGLELPPTSVAAAMSAQSGQAAPTGEQPAAPPAAPPSDNANCCYLCNECAKSFASLEKLEQHMAQAHGSDAGGGGAASEQEDSGRPVTANSNSMGGCDGLPRSPTFSDMSGLDDGLRMSNIESPDSSLVDGNKVYTCRFCAATFDGRPALNVHYRESHGDKPLYECDMCDKIYTVKRELSTHRRTHSGEQTHACTECGKEFGTRQLLKKHWMWHDGKRSHICPHCNKAFFQKGHLTQHLMIHTGTRAFQCHLCDKTFIFKFDLNRHMKIHGPERNNVCDRCGAVFLKSAELRTHGETCTGERPTTAALSADLKPEDQQSGTHTPTADSDRAPSLSAALGDGTPTSAASTPVKAAKRKANGSGARRSKKPALNMTKMDPMEPNSMGSSLFPPSSLSVGTPQSTAANTFTCLFCPAPKTFPTQAAYALHLTYYHFRGAMSQAASAAGGEDQPVSAACSTAAGFSGAPANTGIFGNAGIKLEQMLGALNNSGNNVNNTAASMSTVCSSSVANNMTAATLNSVAGATSAAPTPSAGPLGLLNFNALFSAAAAMAVNSAMEQQQQGGNGGNNNNNDRASAASSGSNESGIDMSPTNATQPPTTNTQSNGLQALLESGGGPGVQCCQSCNVTRLRHLELESKLNAKENELRCLRDTMGKVANIAGGLLKSCGDFDKLWMLHSKEVFSQIHAVLANLAD